MSDREDLPPRVGGAGGGAVSRIESDPGLGFGAFVAMIASVMALNSLGIDSMLPALPQIGSSLGVATENERQWIIMIFIIGFGSAQIIWGSLADRYGRKPILVVSLLFYAIFAAMAGLATSFPLLLISRLLQGVASSASRVVVISIVRDCYSGRTMARVMSLAFGVFFIAPILAPSIGQLITLTFGSWRAIFFFISAYAGLVSIVGAVRLKETLHPEYRRTLSFASVTGAFRRFVTTRVSIGYTMAIAFCFGCMSGFITSVQQIFADVFHVERVFPLIFAGLAGGMGAASFLNSRFVERYGTRRISHAALLGFVGMGFVHLTLAATGHDVLLVFPFVQAVQMFCFGLITSNFSAMAMEPVGDIAGSASSVQGFLSTCIGAVLGSVIGQSFNGTTIPLNLGFAGYGTMILLTVLWTERGRLFRPHHADPKR